MTTKEMIIDVTVKLNELNGNSTLELLDEEIIWYLNDAQNQIIRNNIRPSNDNGFFEIDEVNSNLFSNILVGSNVTRNKEGKFLIPDNCEIILSGTITKGVKKLKLNKVKSTLSSTTQLLPFYKGGNTFVNVLQFGNELKLQNDNDGLNEIYLIYISKLTPITIVDSCILNEFYHVLISELAQQNIVANSGNNEQYRLKRENNSNQILIN